MNVPVKKKNGGISTLFSDFFGPGSLWDHDLFEGDYGLFPSRLGINIPTANVTENPRTFIIELAAPGLERKDFNVEVINHMLVISAEKEEEKKEKEGAYSRKEYSFNSFTRSFSLPENIREGDIDARYENGVLKVTLPKQKETPAKATQKVNVN